MADAVAVSFASRLYRDIGPDVDVLDGDLGCGPREIGFMFGQYKRLSNRFAGAFTGKGEGWGGSGMRTEATGYGVVYFAEYMLNGRDETLAGTSLRRSVATAREMVLTLVCYAWTGGQARL